MTSDPVPPVGPLAADPLADSRWLADGVRLQILLRALPVQRHDVLGPLSVVRMGLAVVQRRLQADTVDLPALGGKLAETDAQVADAVRRVAELRLWDREADLPRPLLALVRQCAALVQLSASMAGHQLEPVEIVGAGAAAVADAADAWQSPPGGFHQAVLGLLMHAIDTAPQPCRLTLVLSPQHLHLRVGALGSAAGAAPQRLPMGPRDRRIDARALAWLLADMGLRGGPVENGWQLEWVAR